MMFTGTNSVLNATNVFVKKTSDSTYYAMDNLPTGFTGSVTKVNDKRVKVVISGATDFVTAGATDATDIKV